ncbi:hypothetical protein A3Q56_03777 [Intoshia linei]|uniref:BRCA2 OB1 domain-containing protein n=1 Tax=Intoshia linei TaxID=1819745 RepID=A0A177B4D8_9BILA|nr:hypothetical protein A3Q56_03777 [Intoshia linei]
MLMERLNCNENAVNADESNLTSNTNNETNTYTNMGFSSASGKSLQISSDKLKQYSSYFIQDSFQDTINDNSNTQEIFTSSKCKNLLNISDFNVNHAIRHSTPKFAQPCKKSKISKIFKTPKTVKTLTSNCEYKPVWSSRKDLQLEKFKKIKKYECGYLYNYKNNLKRDHLALKNLPKPIKNLKINLNDLQFLVLYPNINSHNLKLTSQDDQFLRRNDLCTVKDLKRIFANIILTGEKLNTLWIENHIKLITWKLESYHLHYSNLASFKRILNATNILLQLRYRYDMEYINCKRSCFNLICEKDAVSANTFVCVIYECWKEKDNYHLSVTDGWYILPVKTDTFSKYLMDKKILKSGLKIISSGASLVNLSTSNHPLDVENVFLSFNWNSTRRTVWNQRLGFCKNIRPFPVSLHSIISNCGIIGCLHLTALRIYPVQYMMKTDNGVIWRRKLFEQGEHRIISVFKLMVQGVYFQNDKVLLQKNENFAVLTIWNPNETILNLKENFVFTMLYVRMMNFKILDKYASLSSTRQSLYHFHNYKIKGSFNYKVAKISDLQSTSTSTHVDIVGIVEKSQVERDKFNNVTKIDLFVADDSLKICCVRFYQKQVDFFGYNRIPITGTVYSFKSIFFANQETTKHPIYSHVPLLLTNDFVSMKQITLSRKWQRILSNIK